MKWNEIETWHAYFDIFVRNAFGNFRDVLREVSYSPMMATYLTFLQNKGIAYDASYPDENFAREVRRPGLSARRRLGVVPTVCARVCASQVMQLFTIGLWKLNDDGTQKLDEHGQPIMTYTNDDIVTFSRAWTGHDRQAKRRNIENSDGDAEGGRNNLDPMWINPEWRDPFPKLDLNGGYIGDSYPLCVEAPSRAFLRNGTRWSFIGTQLTYYMWLSYEANALTLDDPSSPLHQAICSRASSGACELRSEVLLPTDLSLGCDASSVWTECKVDTARLVKFVDGNRTAYYEWKRPACVEFPFYENAKVVTVTNSGSREMCADPQAAVGASCCRVSSSTYGYCQYTRERMTYATNAARCESNAGSVCEATSHRVNDCGYKSEYMRHWTSLPCTIKVQVDRSGWVNIVHDPYGSTLNRRPSFAVDNVNIFRVSWLDGSFPSPSMSCDGACEVHGDTCLCDVHVEVERIFDSVPASATDVETACHIGSFCPDAYDATEYVRLGSNSEVEAFMKAGHTAGGGFNENTVYRVLATGKCYTNRRSTVRVGNTTRFAFRNAPHFVSFLEPTSIDSEHETEALLDHLLYHPNTAPFVAHRLIQRFTTSNPTPRYVRAVATAFSTGAFGGTVYSGRYGDLSATIAAILLDREASSPTLDADPTHGVMREPLLKLHSFLRSMEFASRDEREIEMPNIEVDIGMEAHKSPSVCVAHTSSMPPAHVAVNCAADSSLCHARQVQLLSA